jgi:hypothetical protein
MRKIRERNKLCHCGSGKKIKKCCLTESQNIINKNIDTQKVHKEQQEWNQWCEKISELPFRAEIRSTNGASLSMRVTNASVTKDGIKKKLFEDDITLSVNSTNGDTLEESYAIFSVPQNNKKSSEIKLGGNACVENKKEHYSISLYGDKKKIKVESRKGLFASIKISTQRNAGFDYFSIYYGKKGKIEVKNSDGLKNRPHVDFYPSGNGKYIRLSGYPCDFESDLEYCPKENNIFPSKLTIKIKEFYEKLILEFKFYQERNTVILENAYFTS